MKDKYDYLIIGAGLFGSVFAHEACKKGKKCLVIDRRPHVGGNLYCDNYQGIHIHKYGAHIFHTSQAEIWQYVNNLVHFNRFTNSPLATYQGKIYNLPFNMNTFYQLWGVRTPAEAQTKIEEQRNKYASIVKPANLEEQALKLCGDDIYHIFIKEYTEKQWGRPCTELPAFIIRRLPFRFTYDNNYFNDSYQGIPEGGYNLLINALLTNCEVRTNCDYFSNREYYNSLANKILFTGCIDQFFDYRYGTLDYRTLRFEHEYLDIENYQGNAVVNYNEKSVPFTRIIEHKHFEFGTQSNTVITREYPKEFEQGDEPYYPINDKRNSRIYQQYKKESEQTDKVLFGGRLAQYAYFDMDDTIEVALKMSNKEFSA